MRYNAVIDGITIYNYIQTFPAYMIAGAGVAFYGFYRRFDGLRAAGGTLTG